MSEQLTAVPNNVWKFLEQSSAAVGRMEDERFSQEIYSQIVDMKMASPIEQLFFVAIHTLARAEYIEVDPEPYELHGEMQSGIGVHIHPQRKLGRYHADFSITRDWRDFGELGKRGTERSVTVIVELDGHDFHDRDKHQRSYEKARDRFIQRQGYKVLHYTGSDVTADPYRVAHEVLETLGALPGGSEYDASNPLGID